MHLENQREITKIELRHGGGDTTAMRVGIVAIIIALMASFLLKKGPQQVLSKIGQGQSQQVEAKPLTPRQEAMKFAQGLHSGGLNQGDTFAHPSNQL